MHACVVCMCACISAWMRCVCVCILNEEMVQQNYMHYTWEPVRNAKSQATPRPAESETHWVRSISLCFHKFSR